MFSVDIDHNLAYTESRTYGAVTQTCGSITLPEVGNYPGGDGGDCQKPDSLTRN